MSKFLPLTRDEVTFDLTIEEEDMPVRGNAMASGDDAFDREVESKIVRRLNNGDLWAWCIVKVTAKWKGHTGVAYLGGCSYEDEEDFRGSDNGQQENEALDDLNRDLEAAWLSLRAREVPNDYEACGECGFDHSYEANEAEAAHTKAAKAETDYEEELSHADR